MEEKVACTLVCLVRHWADDSVITHYRLEEAALWPGLRMALDQGQDVLVGLALEGEDPWAEPLLFYGPLSALQRLELRDCGLDRAVLSRLDHNRPRVRQAATGSHRVR